MTTRPRSWAIALVVLLSGCAAHLAPAPEAQRVGGHGRGAIAEIAGIRVVARAQAWRSFPSDLAAHVTPLLITVDNRSEEPVLVRYEDFVLEGNAGRTFAAIPPFDIDGAVVVHSRAYGYPYAAPFWHRSPWYPYRAWGPYYSWHYGWDPFFYDPFYDPWITRRVELPTTEMVQQAFSEGVIDAGSSRTGFVYFEEVDDVDRVRLRVELVQPATGAALGAITIPFVVE